MTKIDELKALETKETLTPSELPEKNKMTSSDFELLKEAIIEVDNEKISIYGTEEGKNISGPLNFDYASMRLNSNAISDSIYANNYSILLNSSSLSLYPFVQSYASLYLNTDIGPSTLTESAVGSIASLQTSNAFLNVNSYDILNNESGALIRGSYEVVINSNYDDNGIFKGLKSKHLTEDSELTDTHFIQKNYVDKLKPYKVYYVNLTQSGTSVPTAIIFENTVGDITITRDSIGVYKILSSGLFTTDKTSVIINQVNPLYNITAKINSNSEIQINARNLSVGLDADNVLLNTTLEIRVYN